MTNHSVKTRSTRTLLLIGSIILLNSCATILGGRRTSYQITKPLPGTPQREVRVVALVADLILFWPGAVVDFATGAIYRPVPRRQHSAYHDMK